MKVIKKGIYPKENIIICKDCGTVIFYQEDDIETIVDTTTSDEESFFGGFRVHKYSKCPTCNSILLKERRKQ